MSMPSATELPQMVTEFVDMSKEYLRQETMEPAQRLGRFAGYSLGAALMFATGSLLLAIAATRGIILLLPEGSNWSALGYILGALAVGIVIGIMFGMTSRKQAARDEQAARIEQEARSQGVEV